MPLGILRAVFASPISSPLKGEEEGEYEKHGNLISGKPVDLGQEGTPQIKHEVKLLTRLSF